MKDKAKITRKIQHWTKKLFSKGRTLKHCKAWVFGGIKSFRAHTDFTLST